MKKHELLKFAYDNYPKGTKFISGSKSKEIIESSGVFRISQNESQGTWVTDDVTSYVICSTNGKWVEIVKPKIAVKLPLLTSEDGVDLYEKDSIFIAVKRDEKWMLDWHADEAEDNEQFELTDNGKFISTEKEKYFSTKESALKWIEEQNPKETFLEYGAYKFTIKKDSVNVSHGDSDTDIDIEAIYNAWQELS